MNDGFGEVPIKGEGTAISHEGGMKPSKTAVETTWIEFSLPKHLEAECWEMIKQWLKNKGVGND